MALALPRYRLLSWNTPHAHVWIDPTAPAALKPVSVLPIIGDGPRQMHAGHTYRCYLCGDECEVPIRFRAAGKDPW